MNPDLEIVRQIKPLIKLDDQEAQAILDCALNGCKLLPRNTEAEQDEWGYQVARAIRCEKLARDTDDRNTH